MEFSKKDMKIFKGVAILFMLLLHLFCRKEVNGLYETFPTIDGVPLIYYFALFADACVPIYCFSSGYGFFTILEKENRFVLKQNCMRLFKLLVNYWIILVLFIGIGFLANIAQYPGNLTQFLLNFFTLSSSYNGAWWFMQTYILLVLLSPWLVRITKKYHSVIVLLISGNLYFISYVQRIKHVFDFGNFPILDGIINAVVLLGTSQLPFIVGFIFAKEKIYSKIYFKYKNLKFKNMLCFTGILLLVLIHSIIESLIIAPITTIAFICFFSLMNKAEWIKGIFGYFGAHSTNIWLTHMFFYMTIFPELTFAPRYPILIYTWLILLCLISSYLINLIYHPILRVMDKKKNMVVQGPKAVQN